MMKLCCAVFIFIFLLHIAEFEIYGTGFHTHDSMKNTGCELTHEIQAVFRTNALIFYSQTLVNNSLQDTNRLVKNLSVFTSNCCMEEADSGCFKNKNDILIDRACEDLLSGTKNQAISLCCDQFNAKREECFRSIQHGPPVTIPNIYTVIPFASQCMEYISDQHMFLKTHVYDFSRQYRIFPLKTMAKIILASKKIYDTCCKDSALDFCLEEMVPKTEAVIGDLIAEENKICQIYKNSGKGKTLLRGIQYFTLFHPNASILNAFEFASSYEQLSSKCCDKDKWTSDCFLDISDVPVSRFCSMSSSPAHLPCCQEINNARLLCLNNMAKNAAQDIPKEIEVTSNYLCDLYQMHYGSLIIWFTYEYTRRHREERLDSVLNSVSEFEEIVKHCCNGFINSTCFSSNLALFGINYSTPFNITK